MSRRCNVENPVLEVTAFCNMCSFFEVQCLSSGNCKLIVFGDCNRNLCHEIDNRKEIGVF